MNFKGLAIELTVHSVLAGMFTVIVLIGYSQFPLSVFAFQCLLLFFNSFMVGRTLAKLFKSKWKITYME